MAKVDSCSSAVASGGPFSELPIWHASARQQRQCRDSGLQASLLQKSGSRPEFCLDTTSKQTYRCCNCGRIRDRRRQVV